MKKIQIIILLISMSWSYSIAQSHSYGNGASIFGSYLTQNILTNNATINQNGYGAGVELNVGKRFFESIGTGFYYFEGQKDKNYQNYGADVFLHLGYRIIQTMDDLQLSIFAGGSLGIPFQEKASSDPTFRYGLGSSLDFKSIYIKVTYDLGKQNMAINGASQNLKTNCLSLTLGLRLTRYSKLKDKREKVFSE